MAKQSRDSDGKLVVTDGAYATTYVGNGEVQRVDVVAPSAELVQATGDHAAEIGRRSRTRLSHAVERIDRLNLADLLACWPHQKRDVVKIIIDGDSPAFITRFAVALAKAHPDDVDQLAEMLEHEAGENPTTVVVEIRGGVCDAIYGQRVERAVLVDWDNIEDEDTARKAGAEFSLTDMDDLPPDTAEMVERAD